MKIPKLSNPVGMFGTAEAACPTSPTLIFAIILVVRPRPVP
mgnify:CR=1 FL=1